MGWCILRHWSSLKRTLLAPAPFFLPALELACTFHRIRISLFLFKSMPANKIANHDAALAVGTVFEANNNHAMALGTFPPTSVAVLFADAV